MVLAGSTGLVAATPVRSWDTGPDLEECTPPGRGAFGYFFLCRLALRRFRYLCFDIFLRRFLISEPMQKPHVKGRRV